MHLAFAQQHALECRKQALAALGWVELAERAVVGQRVEQRQERGQRVLEGLV